MKEKDFERGVWIENKSGDLILVDKKDGKFYHVRKEHIESQEDWEKRRQRRLEYDEQTRKIEKSKSKLKKSIQNLSAPEEDKERILRILDGLPLFGNVDFFSKELNKVLERNKPKSS